MSRIYLSYDPEQKLLLPPDLRDWLPEGHMALFISDVVDELDLRAIVGSYESGDGRGRPPYHPLMMVKLLVYGYSIGKVSSRKIEQATYEDVGFRVLACNQHPDHASIAEVERLLKAAAEADAAEDKRYGKGVRGDELPAELARRESRLRKIREAKASLEAEAKEQAKAVAAAVEAKLAARKQREEETGKKTRGRAPQEVNVEEAKPEAKAQRNFTDPESRIMKDGATGSFEQSYNAQIAVDGQAQIIVAATLTQAANDKQQLVPVLAEVKTNVGRLPEKVTADSGYFSTAAVTSEALSSVDLYVTPDRSKKTEELAEWPAASPPPFELDQDVIDRMREKLKTEIGRLTYKQRKMIVEPVFGQLKEVRGFRRFSFRGLLKNEAEWSLICLTHNLLKLFRRKSCLQPA